MKVHEIECKCGFKLRLTDIQFCDFDCGMMGMFDCPGCRNRMLPHAEEQEVTIRTYEVEGKDPGWT